jgi:hypothetical protein
MAGNDDDGVFACFESLRCKNIGIEGKSPNFNF